MTQKDSAKSIQGRSNGNGKPIYRQPIITQPLIANNDDDNLDLRRIGKVVKQRMRLITAITLGVTTLVGLWTFQQPRYKGQFQLLVESNTSDQNNPLNFKGNVGDEVEYKTHIEVLRSPIVLEPIIQQLVVRYPKLDYHSLVREQSNIEEPLKITRLENTKILEISYEDENPQKIEFVLKKLANAYLNYGLKERQAELNQGIDFVDRQLPKVRQQVNQQQEQLQKFRQRHNLLNPEQQEKRLSEQLVSLETQYFDTQIKLKEANSLYTILEQQVKLNPEQAIASNSLAQSSRYQNLLDRLQEIDLEIAKESAVYVEDSPIIQTLKDKRANILPLLRQEAQRTTGNVETPQNHSYASSSAIKQSLNQQLIQTANNVKLLKIREVALDRQIKAIKERMVQMPLIAREYSDFQQQIKVATESLARFLDAQEKLQIEVAQKVSPWQLISPPQLPKEPIYENPERNLALGAIAGLLLGIGAAFLAHKLDRSIHSSDELRESTNLPILGLIPWQKNLKLSIPPISLDLDSPLERQPYYNFSSFSEAFLSLNTNLRFLNSEEPLKSFVISSIAPSEGKSTIALNLAQAAAMMGQRVLLVEADLRNPQFYHSLDVSNALGLCNVIATGIELEAAIQPVSQWENLSILTAGTIPPNATRLLASRRMKQVMEDLQQSKDFDLIIYDTPSLLGFADAKILAAYTQGMMLVTRIGKSDRAVFKQFLDDLYLSHIPILGIVANSVDRRSQQYNYHSNHREYSMTNG